MYLGAQGTKYLGTQGTKYLGAQDILGRTLFAHRQIFTISFVKRLVTTSLMVIISKESPGADVTNKFQSSVAMLL